MVEVNEAEYSAILAVFQVAAKVLAIRLFLFLSLAGSFALSIIANQTQSSQSLQILFVYASVTTLPLAILEWRGRGKIGG